LHEVYLIIRNYKLGEWGHKGDFAYNIIYSIILTFTASLAASSGFMVGEIKDFNPSFILQLILTKEPFSVLVYFVWF
jgi:hypothetical protein